RVQQCAAAGSRLAINEMNAAMAEVGDIADAFGIAARGNESFLPAGESHDGEIFIRVVALNDRHVELARVVVLQVRAGNMYFALLQPVEGEAAGRRGGYDFDSAQALHHAPQQPNG